MAAKISKNELKHRFETEIGAQTAFLNYQIADNTITFTHTEVPANLNGRGIGTRLVAAGLEYAKEHGFKVIPQCPFVAEFIRMHPLYQPMVV